MAVGKKITILLGSPNEDGDTATLCKAFTRGAVAEGAQVETISIGNLALSPVTHSVLQRFRAGEFIDGDGVGSILDKLLASDVIVFATPLYFFGMSAQLKIVVDRFISRRDELMSHPAQACLLVTVGSATASAVDPLVSHFDMLCAYFKWQNCDKVIARGTEFGPITETDIIPEAEELGRRMALSQKSTVNFKATPSVKPPVTETLGQQVISSVNVPQGARHPAILATEGKSKAQMAMASKTIRPTQNIQVVPKPAMVVVEGKPAGYKKGSRL